MTLQLSVQTMHLVVKEAVDAMKVPVLAPGSSKTLAADRSHLHTGHQVMPAAALLAEVVAILPAAVSTGQQVIKLVNDGYKQLCDAVGNREVTPQGISDLVAEIMANSVDIQAIAWAMRLRRRLSGRGGDL